jgi:catechol 2,3-dioxygenase-like lactoylglutathione lyase family enzyme
MRTADLERLERFYVGVLGFAIVLRRRPRDGSVWLDAGGAVLMLECAEAGEPGVIADAMELLAFGIDSDEKEAWRGRLERAGVDVQAETAHTLYFRDPDGRRLAVSAYPLPPSAPP